jgi:hypothetical protein
MYFTQISQLSFPTALTPPPPWSSRSPLDLGPISPSPLWRWSVARRVRIPFLYSRSGLELFLGLSIELGVMPLVWSAASELAGCFWRLMAMLLFCTAIQWSRQRRGKVCIVRCIYLYIVISPYVRGFPAYLHLYLYYILWPLAPGNTSCTFITVNTPVLTSVLSASPLKASPSQRQWLHVLRYIIYRAPLHILWLGIFGFRRVRDRLISRPNMHVRHRLILPYCIVSIRLHMHSSNTHAIYYEELHLTGVLNF